MGTKLTTELLGQKKKTQKQIKNHYNKNKIETNPSEIGTIPSDTGTNPS